MECPYRGENPSIISRELGGRKALAMSDENKTSKAKVQDYMPSPETVIAELSSAKSMDDFFGKDGIFARLFATH